MDKAEKLFETLAAARKNNGGVLTKEKWIEVARRFLAADAKERRREQTPPEAEAIYEAYPRKVGKLAALKAITTALRTSDMSAQGMLVATKRYADAVARWPKDRHQFIPMPATWFNQGRYMDDPATWAEGFRAARPSETTENERLPEPARYREWFKAHYEKEPKPWSGLPKESQEYYLRMMRQLGVLVNDDKVFVPRHDVAEMLAQAFKAE